MPSGLQVWDAAGNMMIDLNTRLSRIVGEVFAPANSSGTVYVDNSLGQPWAIPIPTDFPQAASPTITYSGNSISWAPSSSTTSQNRDCIIIYGVF